MKYRAAAPTALALDIGGGHVTAATVELGGPALSGRPVRREVDHSAEAGVILDAWADAARAAGSLGPKPTCIGLAVPGPFDTAAGVSLMTHKFAALAGTDVRAALRERWTGTALERLPISFGNDADLFALGEWWAGAAEGTERMIGVTLGTGLGSGFVLAGRPVEAGPGVPPGGELWRASYLGDVAERFASGRAVSRNYRERSGRALSAAEVAGRADLGDAEALGAWEDLGLHLGAILTAHVGAFGAQAVVMGGNVSRAWTHFYAPLQAALPGVPCRPSALGETAGLLGAARLAFTDGGC